MIETGLVRGRSDLSAQRNRGHHDAWIDCAHGLVIEAHARDHARREVLDHNIDFAHQVAYDRDCGGIFHVEAEALLAAVLLDVIAAAAIAEKGQMSRTVTARRQFEFNYFSAHLGHQARDRRASEYLAEVENLVTVAD